MKRLFTTIFSRSLVRFVGKNIRYFYFKIIGKSKTKESLSNKFKDDYIDLENAVNQDMQNAIVGSITILLVALILFLIS